MNVKNNLTAVVNLETDPLVQELFKLLRVGNGSNMLNLKIKLMNLSFFQL